MRSNRIVSEVLGDEHAITPSELSHPELRGRWLGGYGKAAVQTLLDRAADRLEALSEELRSLAQENELLKKQMEDRRRMEETLRQALMSSQKFSEDIIESAKREADAILSEARARAEETRLEAGRFPDALAGEISALSAQRDRMRRELLGALDAQRRLVESLYPDEAVTASFVEVHSKEERKPLPEPRNGSAPPMDISSAEGPDNEDMGGSPRQDTEEEGVD